MKFAATIAGALAFVMSAGALAFFAARYVNFDEVFKSKPRQKHYRETLVEGLAVNRHGLYGVDLVRCRSCHIEKRKKGIFTLGGFNVLVIDDIYTTGRSSEAFISAIEATGAHVRMAMFLAKTRWFGYHRD